jgi:hypothetical protein
LLAGRLSADAAPIHLKRRRRAELAILSYVVAAAD